MTEIEDDQNGRCPKWNIKYNGILKIMDDNQNNESA